jgi:type II secretory pathway pseudopilin PulG
MVVVLVMLTIASLVIVLRLQRRSREAAQRASAERRRIRSNLLGGG